jgi:hypothetical protein
LSQLLQLGVLSPQQVQFANPMKTFQEILPLLGFTNQEEWVLQAMPPVQPGAGPGTASQPKNPQDPSQQVANMNPEATGVMNVI